MRGTIACYPPVWGETDRELSLRTVVLTEAVATCLGASALLYGDKMAALCDPYYPKHARLSAAEAAKALAWHRFALRCRDLFIEGDDTSWYEVGDENGAVSLEWEGAVRPEPVGNALFARVVHTDNVVAVGVVDLSGSQHGLWSEPTPQGRCRSVQVRVLVDEPGGWHTSAAVLGRSEDRFTPLAFTVVEHRQGRAVQVELPIDAGWSVLRLVRRNGDRHGAAQV